MDAKPVRRNLDHNIQGWNVWTWSGRRRLSGRGPRPELCLGRWIRQPHAEWVWELRLRETRRSCSAGKAVIGLLPRAGVKHSRERSVRAQREERLSPCWVTGDGAGGRSIEGPLRPWVSVTKSHYWTPSGKTSGGATLCGDGAGWPGVVSQASPRSECHWGTWVEPPGSRIWGNYREPQKAVKLMRVTLF